MIRKSIWILGICFVTAWTGCSVGDRSEAPIATNSETSTSSHGPIPSLVSPEHHLRKRADDTSGSQPQSIATDPPNVCIEGLAPSSVNSPCLPEPHPKTSPTPRYVAMLAPQYTSQQEDSESQDSGALLVVAQGSTAYTAWYCIDPYGNPCANTLITTWSAGNSAAFTQTFDPPATTGAALTYESFTAYSDTAPGLYPATLCSSTSFQGVFQGGTCGNFYIEVVTAGSAPATAPPNLPNYTPRVMLQASAAGASGIIIPGQGHLYVEYYAGNTPFTTLQAGPIFVRDGLYTSFYLEASKFTQYPNSQQAVDITGYVNQSQLTSLYTDYTAYQRITDVPTYDPILMNSNTFADGLLLAAGVSETQISAWIGQLTTKTGFQFPGYGDGSYLGPCFQPMPKPTPPGGRHPLSDQIQIYPSDPDTIAALPTDIRLPVSLFGGCAYKQISI